MGAPQDGRPDPAALRQLAADWRAQGDRLELLGDNMMAAYNDITWFGLAHHSADTATNLVDLKLRKVQQAAHEFAKFLDDYADKVQEAIDKEKARTIIEIVLALFGLLTIGLAAVLGPMLAALGRLLAGLLSAMSQLAGKIVTAVIDVAIGIIVWGTLQVAMEFGTTAVSPPSWAYPPTTPPASPSASSSPLSWVASSPFAASTTSRSRGWAPVADRVTYRTPHPPPSAVPAPTSPPTARWSTNPSPTRVHGGERAHRRRRRDRLQRHRRPAGPPGRGPCRTHQRGGGPAGLLRRRVGGQRRACGGARRPADRPAYLGEHRHPGDADAPVRRRHPRGTHRRQGHQWAAGPEGGRYPKRRHHPTGRHRRQPGADGADR